MSRRNTTLRSLHDLGLAAWFGGSLMGAVGVNGAAAAVDRPTERLRVAWAGWERWMPVDAAAIGAHLVGAAGELVTERHRVLAQSGVGRMAAAKTALTAAALAASVWSGALGVKVGQAGDVPVEGATGPSEATPADVARAQRRLAVLQWAIPALTGGLIVLTALAGEQQKPQQVARGVVGRVAGLVGAGRRAALLSRRRAGGPGGLVRHRSPGGGTGRGEEGFSRTCR